MKLPFLFSVIIIFHLLAFPINYAQQSPFEETFLENKKNIDVVLESGFLIDSVFVTDSNGRIKKYAFEYNGNGNLILSIQGEWNGTNLLDTVRHVYAYSSSGKMLSDLYQRWNGINWENISWHYYNYDLNDKLISHIFSSGWDGNDWITVYQRIYTFNSSGNVISELRQKWDETHWINADRWLFEYDIKGNLVENLHESWIGDYLYGNWINRLKKTYSYDEIGNLTKELIEQFLDDTILRYRYTNTYDIYGNILSSLDEYEDYINSVWVISSRTLFTYNSENNIESKLKENYDGNIWSPSSKYTYSYDFNENLKEKLFQDWESGNWINYDIEKYNYDLNDNLILFVYHRWIEGNVITADRSISILDKFGNNFEFRGVNIELFYSYLTDVETDIIISNYSLYQNFPNPFNPITSIQYSIPKNEFVTLKIYDILGNEIATLVNKRQDIGSYIINFDGRNLSSGLYLYSIQAGSFNVTKKMILLK